MHQTIKQHSNNDTDRRSHTAGNGRDDSADKLRAYTILDNSSMGEWDWQALQLDWDTAQLDDLIKWT